MEDNIKKQIFVLLDSLNISYQLMNHAPIFTVEEGNNIALQLGVTACKSLLLKNKQNMYFLLLVKGEKKFNGKSIASQINSSHLSFATADDLEGLLHCYQGAVSPLGLYYDVSRKVSLLVDKELFQVDYIGCHPCDNTCSVKLRLKDLLELFLPAVHHNYIFVEI